MTSTAISAQGTKLETETGSGAAKNITGIQPGYPTIVTIAAHGFNSGDVLALAGITGSIAAKLNGLSFPATNKTTNTFAVQVDTTGLAYTSGGTATPSLYTEVINVKSFNGFDGAASENDVTNLRSTAKEVMIGLQDFGKLSLNINPDFADPGQGAMRAARAAGLKRWFKLTLPNGYIAAFQAFVKSMPWQGGVDAAVEGTCELRISGDVTITAP